MDRQIVYPAQIPLDSDLLNAQRNAFVGLGHLAGMAYGDDTVAAGGFACTPGTGLAVTIAPGSLLAAGVVDATAYGTLAANGSVLVRQHISRDPVTLSVPGARATYTVYATPATVDADDTVLPFYNAADPSVTYAGADNSGKTAPTVRQDVAQLGIATTVPDGAYPLWTITVPAAATAITADMIAQAEDAPFYETIPELQTDLAGRLKLNDAKPQSVTGPVTFEGETEVPDVVDFTTQGALGARVAEARYIRSVPAAGSSNIQIADIEFDASGNVLVTDAAGNVTAFYPPSLTVSTLNGFPCLTYKIASNMLVQEFFTGYLDTLDGPQTILFPTAYRAGTTPLITASFSFNSGDGYQASVNFNTKISDPLSAVRNTGFDVYARHLDTSSKLTSGFFARSVGEI
ncbi:hypothetical protein ACM0P6_02175 [Komagataeibacter sucrofermentans]|uniref:hypothetical protein n=1 Tax=Komagataeibacter sucrofermentans TaxID=1053551 RepID=UPI001FC9C26C|nr:hypothetical protein [Komagataeibacter sucrofermentans]GBQ46030.1 hypothetical protein AA15973_0783 [Komagataeibacter sucrofermentans DSM 15973]